MKRLVHLLSVGAIVLGTLSIAVLPGHAAGAAAAAHCPTGRLYIAPVPNSGQGGLGHVGLTFSVKSLDQQACYLEGYPGMQLVDAAGHDIATHLRWGGGYLYGNRPKHYVLLKTGQSAYFDLEWVHIPSTGQTCPTASYLLVTPPDGTVTIVVPVQLEQICGGALTSTPIMPTAS